MQQKRLRHEISFGHAGDRPVSTIEGVGTVIAHHEIFIRTQLIGFIHGVAPEER